MASGTIKAVVAKSDIVDNTFVINLNDMNDGGIYTVMVIVEDEYGNMYSAEYQLEVTKWEY